MLARSIEGATRLAGLCRRQQTQEGQFILRCASFILLPVCAGQHVARKQPLGRVTTKMFRVPAVKQAAALGRRGAQRSFAISAQHIVKTEEVQQAQLDGKGVVALESTIISHGTSSSLPRLQQAT